MALGKTNDLNSFGGLFNGQAASDKEAAKPAAEPSHMPVEKNPASSAASDKKEVHNYVVSASVYRDLKRIAYMRRISMSNILEDCIIDYNMNHQKELEEFHRLDAGERKRVDERKRRF